MQGQWIVQLYTDIINPTYELILFKTQQKCKTNTKPTGSVQGDMAINFACSENETDQRADQLQ